jgi:hypothetical protein
MAEIVPEKFPGMVSAFFYPAASGSERTRHRE